MLSSSAPDVPALVPGDRSRRHARWVATGLCGLLVAIFLAQGARTASLPAVHIVSWNVIIDDGFYYLQVARNIARGHGSTFDRVNRTNGYQPLWALMLVPIFWFTDDAAVGIRAALVLATLLGGLGMVLLYVAMQRLVGLGAALLLVGLIAFNPYFVQILLGGLETPVLFACMSALAAVWACAAPAIRAGSLRPCLLLGGLLGLTVLARVDVALILAPLCVALVAVGPGGLRGRLRRVLRIALPGVAVVLPFVLWSWATQGTALPVSGLVKRWVAATYTPTQPLFEVTEQWRGLARTLHLLFWPRTPPERETFDEIPELLRLPQYLTLLAAARLIWSGRARRNTAALLLLATAVVGVAGHGLYMFYIYRSCGHWNYHYFFPFALLYSVLLVTVPALLLADVGLLLDRLVRGRLRLGFAALGAALCLPPLAYLARHGQLAAAGRGRELRQSPDLSFRRSRFDAALYLRRHYRRDEVFGSWWAGTVGYLSNRRVVNLDGVVNSSEFFHRYLRTDSVDRYILQGPIAHLVDFFWRDPLSEPPAWRAFWWEHDKEHIVSRLGPRLRQVKLIPFRGDQGMYVYDVLK